MQKTFIQFDKDMIQNTSKATKSLLPLCMMTLLHMGFHGQ